MLALAHIKIPGAIEGEGLSSTIQNPEKQKAIGDENFKPKEYSPEIWGYDFSEGRFVPYNVTPGRVTRVYTPKRQLKEF